MPNGINDISPDIRDFLLNRNLILSPTILNNGLEGLAQGLGREASIDNPPNNVRSQTNISEDGQYYRDLNLLYNPYKSLNELEVIEIQSPDAGNIGNLPAGSNPVEYGVNFVDDNSSIFEDGVFYRDLNLKYNKYYDEDELNVVNISTDLIASNSTGVYQLRTTLATRTIDAVLNSLNLGSQAQSALGISQNNISELGRIGNEELVKHIGYNSAFGLAQETLGSINLNPLSVLQGNNIIVPNYSITVPSGELGGVIDYFSRVTGVESPVSLFSDDSSIWQVGTKLLIPNRVSNTDRINRQVINTGRGQVLALIDNISENKYKPEINDPRKRDNVENKAEDGTNGNLYVFGDGQGGIKNLLDFGINSGNTFGQQNGRITSELTTDELSLNTSPTGDNIISEGFESLLSPNRNDGVKRGFSWSDDFNNHEAQFDDVGVIGAGQNFNNTKSLLYKTQQLFKTNKMMTLVSGHGVYKQTDNETQNTVKGYMSKGSAVLSPEALNAEDGTSLPPENTFCRTWTTFDRYDSVEDLQKNDGLYGSTSGQTTVYRRDNSISNSVLDDNGFVRVAPVRGDNEFDRGGGNGYTNTKVKRFMLSLENLAWSDSLDFLPKCEIGPGDPLTETQGRIMWFPPYDLNFSDTSSANWDTTEFIGRGEPIYTYNNTERIGNLSFKMIIDHAAYMNDARNWDNANELFASIVAGCSEIPNSVTNKLTNDEANQVEIATNVKPPQVTLEPPVLPPPFKVYFPNDRTDLYSGYENGDGKGLGSYKPMAGYITQSRNPDNWQSREYEDDTDYGLNGCVPITPETIGNTGVCGQLIDFNGKTYFGWLNNTLFSDIAQYIVDEAPSIRILLDGFASQDGQSAAPDANQKLSDDRATTLEMEWKKYLIAAGDPLQGNRIDRVRGEGATGCDEEPEDVNRVDTFCKKTSRYTKISFKFDAATAEEVQAIQETIVRPPEFPTGELNLDIRKRFLSECDYFEKLEQEDKFIYDSIRTKIRHFHPSFHSTTPEGFNSRLNFLKQCTRQGPTLGTDETPTNLAFGKPPVCILRVGDFYHTKIIIDNVDFSFDPIVWDLNPEGVGVQPMICNVNLSFKFIGGSSLNGPINRLQNAVSFNFFANTEIYDERADYIKINNEPNGKNEIVNGVNPNNFDTPEEGYRYLDAIELGGLTNDEYAQVLQSEKAAEQAARKETQELVELPEFISAFWDGNFEENIGVLNGNLKVSILAPNDTLVGDFIEISLFDGLNNEFKPIGNFNQINNVGANNFEVSFLTFSSNPFNKSLSGNTYRVKISDKQRLLPIWGEVTII